MKYENTQDLKKEIDEVIISDKEWSLSMLNNILKKLPTEYADLIEQTFIHKRVPKEYMLSSIFFTISTSIGLTFYIDALGYTNYANLYFTIIGSRGDTKSEAMKIATEPLKELDDQDYEEYEYEMKIYDKENEEEPIRKQLLIQNASIEAVHKIHSENPNSVGISYDEIYSLIEKMGNSSNRDGVAWRTFFLEGYTNGHVDVSRKTTKSFRIKDTYVTMLGGLQHQFVPKLFANGNLESGFIDRQLYTPKLTRNNKLSRDQTPNFVINNYKIAVLNILAYKRQSEQPNKATKQFKIELSMEAEDKLFNYIQNLIDRQIKAEPMIKEYMAKMQISIHKFCLLVHMMKNSSNSNFRSVLDIETVDLAVNLNEFYFINFKIILDENLSYSSKDPSLDEIIKLAMKNGAQQKDVVAITGKHKGTVSKSWNKNVTNQQLATSKNLKRVV